MSEFVVNLKLIWMVTFHRYCLVIVREATMHIIDNVWIVKILNCILGIARILLPYLIVLSMKR
jgi:hypothetical protein